MKSSVAQIWIDPEEEVTQVVHTLAALQLSPFAIVEQTTPLEEVRSMFVELRVAAIGVVDRDHGLRGIITRTDVLRDLWDPAATAGDAMSGFVLALSIECTVEHAAALMATEGVGQVVVTTRHGEAAGVLSAVDVARYVATRAGYIA